jgi:hypothetical protein
MNGKEIQDESDEGKKEGERLRYKRNHPPMNFRLFTMRV